MAMELTLREGVMGKFPGEADLVGDILRPIPNAITL